jgi:hypothetical protein
MVAVPHIHSVLHSIKSSVPSVVGRKMDATPPVKKNKAVRFDQKIRLVSIPNRKELTKDEIKSMYFSRKDLKRIRHDVVSTLKLLGKQKRFDTCFDTMRGLECFVPSYADKREKRIDFARAAVVKEIWISSDDDERMAEMYRSISEPSVCIAAIRGRKDQLATTASGTACHSPSPTAPVIPSSIQ